MNRLALMVLKNLPRLPRLLFKLLRYAKHPENYPEQERYDLIRDFTCRAVRAGNVELQVFGQEYIPAEGGVMLYGNHQGLFDAIAICATCARPLGAVYKIELQNTPIVKQCAACTKSFAMDRADVRQSLTVIQNVTKEVASGRAYVIFPEGTRSKNGNVMGEFHSGSFRAAVKAKCPIVPFALIGSYQVLDQKGAKPVVVQLHYLPAIPYSEYKDLKTTELADLVKARIQEIIDRFA